MDLPAPLDQQIGPYPAGVWVGLIGGGVALGLVIRARRRDPAASDGTLPVISDDAGQPTSTAASGTSGASSVGTRVGLPQGAAPDTGPAAPETNLAWSIAAIRALVDGGADPATAQAAIARFLAGGGLTTAERSLVGRAIAQLGPPPESAPAITVAPDQPPVSTTPTYQAPPAPAPAAAAEPAVVEQITPPGALVSPDGDTVFFTDGIRVQWVQSGHQSIALWQAGSRVKSVVGEGTPGAYPEPLYLSADSIRALRRIGPFPPGF